MHIMCIYRIYTRCCLETNSKPQQQLVATIHGDYQTTLSTDIRKIESTTAMLHIC